MKPVLAGHSVADHSGTILSIDAAVGELLDLRICNIVGKSYTNITYHGDISRNIREIQYVAATNRPRMIRKRYARADGTLIHAEVHVSIMSSATFGVLTLGTIFMVDDPKCRFDAESLWREAKRLWSVGIVKADEMGEDLFADQGWLTMLELYIAECEGKAPFADRSAGFRRDEQVQRWLAALRDTGQIDLENENLAFAQLTSRGTAQVEAVLRTELRSRATAASRAAWPS
ncbi:PAS domain-containing protein [Sphingomonas sp. PWP1-2]|uniref:PAS domain-containing protein n=1 Tax=Sphingomonas sp. PWP1-2 TaxID=2804558 RepID=UPI003CF2D833